jgi:hypothetical protein
MAVSIIYDRQERKAALYDTVSDMAFGPIFTDNDVPVEAPYYSPDAETLAESFVAQAVEAGIELRYLSDEALVTRKMHFLIEQLAAAYAMEPS